MLDCDILNLGVFYIMFYLGMLFWFVVLFRNCEEGEWVRCGVGSGCMCKIFCFLIV